MARRSEVESPAVPGQELVFRPSLSGVVRLPWFAAVLGTAIVLVAVAIVVPAEDRVDLWLTAAVLVAGAAGGLLWRLLVSGTTADAEGLTTVRIRAAGLSWPDVQGLALRAGGVFAYDTTGRHHLLHHVPPTRRALADLDGLWLAGRGADWTRSVEPPEPPADHRFQDPHAPAPIRFTTGLGTGFGVGALSLFFALYVYTDLYAFTGAFETRRELVTALLFWVGAPVVGFTCGLTMTRVRRRKALADYAVHRREVERRVRRLHR